MALCGNLKHKDNKNKGALSPFNKEFREAQFIINSLKPNDENLAVLSKMLFNSVVASNFDGNGLSRAIDSVFEWSNLPNTESDKVKDFTMPTFVKETRKRFSLIPKVLDIRETVDGETVEFVVEIEMEKYDSELMHSLVKLEVATRRIAIKNKIGFHISFMPSSWQ